MNATKSLLFLLLLFSMSSLDAQPDTTAKKAPSPYWHRSVFLMGASFQLQEPVGDLSRRFGLNQNVGFTATYFHKTDLFGEIEFNYLFCYGSHSNIIDLFCFFSDIHNSFSVYVFFF